MKKFSSLVVGFYAWMITIFFGGILIDIVYAKFLTNILSESVSGAILPGVSDILLFLSLITILAAIGAITFSWKSSRARNLFVASLFLVIFELTTPVFVSRFITDAQDLIIGPWLRVIFSGSASLLTFIGLLYYISKYRSENLT